jgi:predicted metal-binding membrane protein
MSRFIDYLDRRPVYVFIGLTILVIACWIWIGAMSVDMYAAMSGTSRWMMTEVWDASHVLLLLAMWTAMMVGMMLPSAAPMLLLYARVVRGTAHESRKIGAFAAGYAIVWFGFSLVAVFLQLWLRSRLLLSPMMELSGAATAGAMLLAGAYQLTGLKRSCLDQCRTPATFIAEHWRKGVSGALRMGLLHGAFCVGCCWALMLLLFAGGIMNLWVIAAITNFVLIEKLAPYGWQGGRLSGGLLMCAGMLVFGGSYF